MEQIRLTITLDREDEPAIALRPEQRRSLMDLMAAAIIAVHRARHADAGEEDGDDAAE